MKVRSMKSDTDLERCHSFSPGTMSLKNILKDGHFIYCVMLVINLHIFNMFFVDLIMLVTSSHLHFCTDSYVNHLNCIYNVIKISFMQTLKLYILVVFSLAS